MWSTSLHEVFNGSDVNLTVGALAGLSAIHALCAASQVLAFGLTPAARRLRASYSTMCCALGGIDDQGEPLCDAESYNPWTGAWEVLPSMESATISADDDLFLSRSRTAAVIGDYIYVCGGVRAADGAVSDSAQRYRHGARSWETLPRMLQARYGHSIDTVGGCVYVCGGMVDENHALSSAERFDPKRMTWLPMPAMSRARSAAVTAVIEDRLVVAGGAPGNAETLRCLESYNADGNVWELLVPMDHAREDAVFFALKGRLYVCGGVDASVADQSFQREPLRSAQCYCLSAGAWEVLPSMHVARLAAFSASLYGCLYVCGGLDKQGGESLNSVERYDPIASAWEVLPPLSQARVSACAFAVAGKLYICGGSSAEDSGPLSSVERFDPFNGAWALIQPMTRARVAAKAVTIAEREEHL